MKKILIMKHCLCLLLLVLPCFASAQISPTAQVVQPAALTTPTASVNIKVVNCLGVQLPYKNYPSDIMNIIQGNLALIYTGDPDWHVDLAQTGKPLTDGKMGPVTWSWMQRFCFNFATPFGKKVVEDLPVKIDAIAAFGKLQGDEKNILISNDFSIWRGQQAETEQLAISATLYQADEAGLLALVARYKNRNNAAPTPVAATPPIKRPTPVTLPNRLYLYSLTAKDFSVLKGAQYSPDALKKVTNIIYTKRAEAEAAVRGALKTQPKAIQEQALAEIVSVEIYQLSDEVLVALANAGLSDTQIAALNALPIKEFTDVTVFTATIKTMLTQLHEKDAPAVIEISDKKNEAKASETIASETIAVEATPSPSEAETQEAVAEKSRIEAQEASDVVALIRILSACKKMTIWPFPEAYEIDDGVLIKLTEAGLSAAQIAALNALPKKESFNRVDFTAKIKTLLVKLHKEKPPETKAAIAMPKAADELTEEQKLAAALAKETDQNTKDSVMLIRILNASKIAGWLLPETNAQHTNEKIQQLLRATSLPSFVVDLLVGMQDIEYPDGYLLHAAVSRKLQRSLGACKANRANSVDNNATYLSVKNSESLRSDLIGFAADAELKNAVERIFPSDMNAPRPPKYVCDELYYEKLKMVYDALIKPAIETVYRKPAPAYSSDLLKWSGKHCGCAPKNLQSMAYGIFPYWHLSKDSQELDFSTFSRVGYYGLSFNTAGQLLQSNTDDHSKTVLTNPDSAVNNFITAARTYGSKVDWVIEKDWDEELTGNEQTDVKNISAILNGLRKNIVNLLGEPLTDPYSRFMPIASLGVAHVPRRGDGVTLYFKHYPSTESAKTLFNNFFKALKIEVSTADEKYNRWAANDEYGFVNIITSQKDFTDETSVFGKVNIKSLIGIDEGKKDDLTKLQVQNQLKTLILVLMHDPYYNSIDELYGSTSPTVRDIIIPIMFMDYKNFNYLNNNHLIDERQKNIDYLYESYGGAGFWPMLKWQQKDTDVFSHYVATQFALGKKLSLWEEKLCGYRWYIIGVMNFWLCFALAVVIFVFYVFPQQCKRAPAYVEVFLKPIPIGLAVLPPVGIWIGLIILDNHFPFISPSALLVLLLAGLSIKAGIQYVNNLKQRVPNRNLLAVQQKNAVPSRTVLSKAPELSSDDSSSEQ